MTHRRSGHRGVTLIEVMVSLSISAVLSTIAISTVVYVNRVRLESQARAQLISDAMLVTQMFGRDMSFLGVGVPRGFRMDQPDFATADLENYQLRPPVRIARRDNLAFVGDLPYPNAEINGVVSLVYVKNHPAPASPATSELFISSELSPCIPDGGTASNCSAPARTLVPGTWVAADDCSENQPSARLCPMGLNKWQLVNPTSADKRVALTIAGLDGSWYSRVWRGGVRKGVSTADEQFMAIVVGAGSPNGTSWNNGASGMLPSDASFLNRNGGSYIATIDRVFWSFETQAGEAAIDAGGNVLDACVSDGCVLRRRQCWGVIENPSVASFPGISTSHVLRSGSTITNCAVPTEGTEWETIARGVRSFRFSYYDDGDAGNPEGRAITTWDLDDASSVGKVELEMTLARPVSGTDSVSLYTVRQRYYLENAGGLTTPPSRYPGCLTGASCVRPIWDKDGRCEAHRCGAPGNQAGSSQNNDEEDTTTGEGEGEGEGE